MAQLIEFVGTGGVMEGNFNDVPIEVNQDSALYFSGDSSDSVSDHVTMGDNDLITTGDFSLSVWIKPETNTTHGACVLGKQSNYNINSVGYGLYWTASSTEIYFNVGDGSNGARSGSSSYPAGVDSWTHIAGTYNATTKVMILYVNGVQVDTDTATGCGDLSASNTSHLRLGANGADPDEGDAHYKGYIADGRLYSDVLTAAEVKVLASKINIDSALGPGIANLLGWWKCNEGTSHTITDYENVSTDYDGLFKRNDANYSTDIWKFDQFSVAVQDATTTTDGAVTVTQGKLDCKALTSQAFDGVDDYMVTPSTIPAVSTNHTISAWVKVTADTDNKTIFDVRDGSNDGIFLFSTAAEAIEYQLYGNDINSASGLAG